MADIVERLNQMVATPHVSFHYKDDWQAVAEATAEIISLRAELEASHERETLHRADASVAWGQVEGLRADLEKVRAELDRFKSEREYIVGCNDGWDEAVEQACIIARSYWHGDKPHLKRSDETCSTIADDIEKLLGSRALATNGKEGRP